MEATLAVLNDLVTEQVIEKYAIGGAVGAIFWVEPFRDALKRFEPDPVQDRDVLSGQELDRGDSRPPNK